MKEDIFFKNLINELNLIKDKHYNKIKNDSIFFYYEDIIYNELNYDFEFELNDEKFYLLSNLYIKDKVKQNIELVYDIKLITNFNVYKYNYSNTYSIEILTEKIKSKFDYILNSFIEKMKDDDFFLNQEKKKLKDKLTQNLEVKIKQKVNKI